MPDPSPTHGPAIRVVLVDDEPLVRRGLAMILDSEPDLEVVGEAGDGAEAVALVRRLRPDVVCMDVRMPGVDGIRATELVLRLPDPPRVLVVTTFASDEHVVDALAAGASGFLLKRARAEEMVLAVRTVAAGQSLLFPEAVRTLLRPQRRTSRHDGPVLTPRESQVLGLVARGLTNAEVAAELVVGIETVRTHVASVLAKLGARDRTQAVVIAYRTGLVEP
ncbi:response regulator transcription factor [Auraticoccus monumenti]|uniref:DNA-binding response regulator, NarL/FixJ family, contains REC and HTH domains n=1 Tax=Auraticoccus monumenti TaxID=675864 RepID=A0A1G6W3B9_9ACTN|nr:response regulator transcription factor [Auraticoccus monumenti]SDD60440.1 DNA-binding response regulator, NarL/FixJ family, contains REC and HTH domains [Auraticoccus monumenti]